LIKDIIEPVELDLIYRFHQHSQFSFRETLAFEPLDIEHRQISQNGAFVFSERHFHGDGFQEEVGIEVGHAFLLAAEFYSVKMGVFYLHDNHFFVLLEFSFACKNNV